MAQKTEKHIEVIRPVKVGSRVFRRQRYAPGTEEFEMLKSEAELEGGAAEYVDVPVPVKPKAEEPPPEPEPPAEIETKDDKAKAKK